MVGPGSGSLLGGDMESSGAANLTRRDVVVTCAHAAVCLGVVATVSGCGGTTDDTPAPSAGDASAATTNASNVASLPFTTFTQLKTNGGSHRLTVTTQSGSKRIVSVTRTGDSTASAVLAVCTHEGVTLGEYAGQKFTCPRHGATFTATGEVTLGPATTALVTYPATVTDTGVDVTVT